MSGFGKQQLPVYHSIVASSMATSVTSPVTDVRGIDNVQVVLIWSGTPTGTFAVQSSSDYLIGPGGTVGNAGTWITLPLSSTITASGSADDALIDLNQLPGPYIQVVYTESSGTGTLDMYISGKGI